ncbi:MAG: hypothetical protein WC139_07010 [Candidatus Kapaibacterium sp.]
MKNIILMVLLIAGLTYGQEWTPAIVGSTGNKIDVVQNQAAYDDNDSGKVIAKLVFDVNYNAALYEDNKLKVAITDTPFVQLASVSLSADSITIKAPTAITNGTKLVASTAAALAGSASAKYVVITNNNASGTVYWGGTGVTTATGEPIYPMMSVQIPIANAATVYVIGAAVTVRYKILN